MVLTVTLLTVITLCRVWGWEAQYGPGNPSCHFEHMKLVERFLSAAAFHRACHCLYLGLQNTKRAVAGNAPLPFLTAERKSARCFCCSFPDVPSAQPRCVTRCFDSALDSKINSLELLAALWWRLHALQWYNNTTEKQVSGCITCWMLAKADSRTQNTMKIFLRWAHFHEGQDYGWQTLTDAAFVCCGQCSADKSAGCSPRWSEFISLDSHQSPNHL